MPTSRRPGGRSGNTFVLRILQTDEKDWVGTVSHVQSGRKTSFRGFIEAVRFIDDLVGGRTAGARDARDARDTRDTRDTRDARL